MPLLPLVFLWAPRRVGALLMAVLFASISLGASNAYAWCPHMERAAAHSCCAGAKDAGTKDAGIRDGEEARPDTVERNCCAWRVNGELPTIDRRDVDETLAPELSLLAHAVGQAATMAARPVAVDFVPTGVWTPTRVPIRAGPGSATERCILLQVFLL